MYKAEAELLSAEDELDEAYTVVDNDSSTIPQIFVSPARSGLSTTESQLILLKAQEYAKDIIGRAIDINSGLHFPDIEFEDAEEILDSTESQILLQAREIVHDIIETALEINTALCLVDTGGVLELAEARGLFDAGDLEMGPDSLQSQAFEKAKELVHDAVARAVEINASVSSMQADSTERRSSRGEGGGLKTIESQMTMFKAQEIVNRVIGHAIRMNIGKIQSEYIQATIKQKTEVSCTQLPE